MLKLCGSQISKPVTDIYSKSLTCGMCTNCLKYGIIKPCFKKGDESQLSNYIPVSVLTGFSEVYELLVFHRLKCHLVSYNILANEHISFHDNVSTESAIFKLIVSIFSAWNSKEYTGCNRRNGPDFGRVFLMLNYTEKPQNTYIQS